MRYWSIFFMLVALALPAPGSAQDLPVPSATPERLTPRPLDALAAEIFTDAVERSAMVRTLVSTLETSNVIVHIESSRLLPIGIAGTTRFVTSRGGFRYVRVTVSSELAPSARLAILGHELQHACEVAESGADDAEDIEKLFKREGQRSGRFYETRAALDTERHVRMEVQAGRALQTEPVVKYDH